MDQLFQLFGVLAEIIASLTTLYILSFVIGWGLFVLLAIVKAGEPEPWDR
ncbi:MAG: hypothetical protein NZ735_03250 [Candidatus Marinimicrobia bacterium]|nr:hypothetical protein [Candidatus Neomarinimicrobiota bacterium]